MSILQKILSSKRAELPTLRKRKLPTPPSELPAFVGKRRGGPLRLICEIKKKSPSAGVLSTALSVQQRAKVYEECGASAISVLCDSPFFDGDYDDLVRAREGSNLPLLCKEFVIDECQLDAARAYGASAVLLIVRCIEPERLETLIDATEERGLTPFVEAYTKEEAKRAIDAGATCVGVNARDLDTLEMDSKRAEGVLSWLPDSVVRAHLSGVKTSEDIRQVRAGPADAALIGEVLMRLDNPTPLLDSLVATARR